MPKLNLEDLRERALLSSDLFDHSQAILTLIERVEELEKAIDDHRSRTFATTLGMMHDRNLWSLIDSEPFYQGPSPHELTPAQVIGIVRNSKPADWILDEMDATLTLRANLLICIEKDGKIIYGYQTIGKVDDHTINPETALANAALLALTEIKV